jgi:hypothetical protein
MRKLTTIEGAVYNDYIVIGVSKPSENGTLFFVKCTCGREEYKLAKHLISGRTKRCKSCSAKTTFKKYTPETFSKSWKGKGLGLISKTWFLSIKNGAEKRKIPFNVTLEEIWKLATDQQFKCALTGASLFFSKAIHKSNPDWKQITASLDRKNSEKGYTIENLQWVHKDINRFKNNYDQEKFIQMCKQVVDYYESGTNKGGTCGV